VLHGPIDRLDERVDRSGQRIVKDLDREDFGFGRFLANDGGYRGAVAESVDEIGLFAAIGCDAYGQRGRRYR